MSFSDEIITLHTSRNNLGKKKLKKKVNSFFLIFSEQCQINIIKQHWADVDGEYKIDVGCQYRTDISIQSWLDLIIWML